MRGELDIFPILCDNMLVFSKFIPQKYMTMQKDTAIELDRTDVRILTALQEIGRAHV